MTTRCLSLGYFLKTGDYLLNFSLCSFTNWVINQGFWNTENLHYSLHKEPHGKDKRPQVQAVSGLALFWYMTFFLQGEWLVTQTASPVMLCSSHHWRFSVCDHTECQTISARFPFLLKGCTWFSFKVSSNLGCSTILIKPWASSATFSLKMKITSRAAFLKPKEQINVKNILHKTH